MKIFSVLSAILISSTFACGSVGKRFDSTQINSIKEGVTKKSEILNMFGLPFKEGEQNRKTTWTYQHHLYSVFDKGQYRDLVILFDENEIVQSYRFTSSAPSP